jgi:type I restriction enzyme S subunit
MEQFELPEAWKLYDLRRLIEIKYGDSLPAKNRNRTGTVPVYGSNGIIGKHDSAITASPVIIIGRKGSIGAVNYSPEPCWPIDTAFFIDEFPATILANWLFLYLTTCALAHFSQDGPKPGIRRDDLYNVKIPLPPIDEQHRIVTVIEKQTIRVLEMNKKLSDMENDFHETLHGVYADITKNAKDQSMSEVAPLVRRRIEIDPLGKYPELGIRSFGKGTFHKPTLTGAELGSKRIFRIEEGDLLFNIVFAWEGAVAVARPEDHGRVGSHRFLTCVPQKGVAMSPFLCFHFLTERGLHDLGDASPGGAGRNRTLGLKALDKIKIPVPPYKKQVWFSNLWGKMNQARQLQGEISKELAAYTPSLLAKAFRGEL